MSSLPIQSRWTKTPGPGFVGGPDGRIIDINDWRVLVRSHLLLEAAVELTRFEANDPGAFRDAQEKCAAMIENKVYGELHAKLEQLRRHIEFTGDEKLVAQIEEIVAMVAPRRSS